MSKALGMRCVWGLCGVLAGVFGFAPLARAEVTSDTSGSIVVFPKVAYSEGGRDTVIQLSNIRNVAAYAWCFYVDARESFGRPLWRVTDFRVRLTPRQPTHWVVSSGRQIDNGDNFGDPVQDGAGIDPGAIPPVQDGFEGELKCVQTDPAGMPMGGDSLIGEAVLISDEGDVAKYNAVAVGSNPDFAGAGDPNELLLNNTQFNDGEYFSCANEILIDHFTDGAATCEAEDGSCPIRPYLTVVPCEQDFENVIPEKVTVQFEVVNEFENVFSTSTTVDCWLSTRMADIDIGNGTCFESATPCTSDDDCANGICEKSNSIFSYGVLGTNTAFTTMVPVDLDGGVIAIGEEQHLAAGGADEAWTAWNLHQRGTRYEATIDIEDGPRIDRIRIPEQF